MAGNDDDDEHSKIRMTSTNSTENPRLYNRCEHVNWNQQYRPHFFHLITNCRYKLNDLYFLFLFQRRAVLRRFH